MLRRESAGKYYFYWHSLARTTLTTFFSPEIESAPTEAVEEKGCLQWKMKEEETLENKAGKSLEQLEDQGGDLPDLGLDLAVLGVPVIENTDILERIFSFLRDPASVKAVSLVSR